MSLFEQFKNYLFGPNHQKDPELVSFEELEKASASTSVVTTEAALPVVSTPSVEIPASEPDDFAQTKTWVMAPPTPIEWPAWLQDEAMLRDEGVVFGLSSSNVEEKVSIIRNYFAHQTADLQKAVDRFAEKLQELNLFIEQKENRINELKQKTQEWEAKSAEGEHQLPRTIVGLVFSIAMCVGNYFLIEDTLRPLYPNSPWIAIGVFLAGMFNLFGRVSLFHDTESNVSWRRLLEEIGMPLAAAIFVFVQALQSQTPIRAVALLIFVFFLFLFAGKLLLSNITVLRNDLRIWLTGNKLHRERNNKTENWDEEINDLTLKIDELRVQKWQIVPEMNRAEAELDRLNARRDALIKLFESEFNLARQLRERLTERQLRDFSV
jgi:hypothetical protein